MNYSQKMLLNEGLMMLGFAYAVQGQTLAAIYFSTLAAFAAVLSHSLKSLVRCSSWIIVLSLIELLFISLSGVDPVRNGLGFSFVMNTVMTILWAGSSQRVIQPILSLVLRGYGILMLIACVLPSPILAAGFGRAGAMLLLGMMGLPVLLVRMVHGYRKKELISL